LVQPLWKTVWRYLTKLNIELLCDPAIPLLGIYKDKTFIEKDTCTRMFIAKLFTIAKTRKQPKSPSTDDWIKKIWYTYTMKYYSATKKNKIMPFSATWMELETFILREVSQKEKDKYHTILLISGIQNLSTEKKIKDLEDRLVVANGEGGGGVGWTRNLGLIDANYCLWNG